MSILCSQNQARSLAVSEEELTLAAFAISLAVFMATSWYYS
jgi:hypothetical protein